MISLRFAKAFGWKCFSVGFDPEGKKNLIEIDERKYRFSKVPSILNLIGLAAGLTSIEHSSFYETLVNAIGL